MERPQASRPYMPGYGIAGPTGGSGLLDWSWAAERLASSRNYWVVSTFPDGRPHAMPVWGIWHEEALWFCSGLRSRKVRNLAADPRCVVAVEDAVDPVVLEGTAEVVSGAEALARFLAPYNAKYATSFAIEFLDPAVNATVRVQPRWAFGLVQEDFTGSPTRWSFERQPPSP